MIMVHYYQKTVLRNKVIENKWAETPGRSLCQKGIFAFAF
jgi:hypothetical protein